MSTHALSRRELCSLLACGPAALGILSGGVFAEETTSETSKPVNTPDKADHQSPELKVLLPIGDASEVMDTLYPFFRLPEDGFKVVVAGPEP